MNFSDQSLSPSNRSPQIECFSLHSSSPSLFPLSASIAAGRGIPPERVGVEGEYDHAGLAKRVALRLKDQYSQTQVENLRVTQRGRVVILAGQVTSWELIQDLSIVALQVEGAAFVETNGLRVVDASFISSAA